MLKLRGLYYITHIENLPSILQRGILCHRRVEEEKIKFTPIYDSDIVKERRDKQLPGGRNLWDFANLYFQPRNAMLFRVVFYSGVSKEDIIIIGIKNSILNRNDIFITTGNAASTPTKFLSGKDIQTHIKQIREKTDKEWWAVEDGSKRELMAECLVPDNISPDYISEIYVPNHNSLEKVKSKINGKNIPIIPEPELFFMPSRRIKLSEYLSLVEGDMFFSRMQTITVSVNTMGIMGKGVALRARYQFPDVFVFYQDLCKKKILKMGKPYLYKREQSLDSVLADEAERLTNINQQTWFLLFPTKTDWRKMADINGIEEGLKWLVRNYKEEGIESIAMPALGCGLGWLSWGLVGPMLSKYLQKMPIPIEVYLPVERKIPEEQLSEDFLLK